MPPRIIVNPIKLSKVNTENNNNEGGQANHSGQLTSRSRAGPGGRLTAQALQQQPLRSARSEYPTQTPLTARSGAGGVSPRFATGRNTGRNNANSAQNVLQQYASGANFESSSPSPSATPRNTAGGFKGPLNNSNNNNFEKSPSVQPPPANQTPLDSSIRGRGSGLQTALSMTMGRSGKLNVVPSQRMTSRSGEATPSVRSENMDLNLTRVMSGALTPKLAVSASRADIVLSLQQKLRDAYIHLVQQSERGLLVPRKSGSAAAPQISARYARRRAIFNDPTQRATLSVYREDSAVIEGNNSQGNAAGSGGGNDFGAGAGYHQLGFTCVEDSLPARLAIFQSDNNPNYNMNSTYSSLNNSDKQNMNLMTDQHGSLVVIQGYAGIGKSMIWKQLCAQQRVPGALVIHVPLMKLRDTDLGTNKRGKNNHVESIGELMRVINAPLALSDITQIVRHRIPIVWCLDGFESEKRYCREFLHIMVTMKKSREKEADEGDNSGNEKFDFGAENNDFLDAVGDDGKITDMRDYHDLKQRYIDSVVLTSVDGSITIDPNAEKHDSLLALQKLATTSLASIAATTQQRVSNIERWTVQRWPMGITKEFIKKYCTGKAKPHKIVKHNAASPSPSTGRGNNNNNLSARGNNNNSSPNSSRQHQQQQQGDVTKVPAEDFLWNTVLSLNQMGSLMGIPLFLQCICDVFIGNEDLLEPLRTSGNPKVTLFELCLKLQWSKQLPHIEALLSSSALREIGSKKGHEAANDEYSASFSGASAANTDAAFMAMTDSAGKFCVDLLAKGGMECDVTWSQKSKNDVEPLWIQLLALLGVVKKIKLASQNSTNGNNNTNDDDEEDRDEPSTASTSAGVSKFTIVFHNRLLVEYFAACHISQHPEKLVRLHYHTRNRFLWMALTHMSSENSRVLSQKGIISRISEKYSEGHPLWLDAFNNHVSLLYVDRYKTLAEDLRHDRRKNVALGNYTHTPLLVEMSTVLGSNSNSLMTAVKRRHGFIGATFRMPSHFGWSFELCGDFGAAATLNWIIDNYKDQVTQNKSLLSRTLARALQREQLGSVTAKTIDDDALTAGTSRANNNNDSDAATSSGGVIHRLYELGATIELFTAVRLGSTTAVAECFETPEFTLDSDSYRQCLMIAVENRDSDMAALVLSHARCAELLDAWVVAAVFILRPRVRFTNKSVQRKKMPSKNNTLNDTTMGRTRSASQIYASPDRSRTEAAGEDGEGADSSFYTTQMTTIEFLEDWTKDCTGLHPDQLQQVDELLKLVLQRQLDYERVHTQAAEMAGGRGSMISHNFQAAINSLNLNKKEQEQLLKLQQQQQQKKIAASKAASEKEQKDKNNSDSVMSPAAAAVAALAAMHPANRSKTANDTNKNNNANNNDDDDSKNDDSSNNNNNNTSSATPPLINSHTAANYAQLAASATRGGGSNNNSLLGNTALENMISGGLQYCVEVRVDAIFWWLSTDPESASQAIAPSDAEEINFLAFDEFPNSFQLDTIVGTIGDCDSVKHVSLRLQECEQLSDATLISLVQSVGTKLVDLGVTYAGDITDAAMLSLARYCPHLAAIDVTRCYCLTNKSLEAFAQNFRSSLRKLVMEFVCLCDDEGLITIVEHAPNLDTLDVAYCKELTDSSMLVVAQKCPNLEYLRFDGCELLTDATLITVTMNCGKLRSLKCRDVLEITSEGISAAAEHCPGLKAIDISFCWRVDDKGVHALAKHCRNIEELWITECSSISDKSLLEIFRNNSNLKTIDMSGCYKLNDDCLIMLANESWSTLENLAVSRCDLITDDAISKVCSDCIYLRSLYISFCDLLTDKSLVAILSDAKRVIDLQCSPSVVQESKNAFSEYLMAALGENLDRRIQYEQETGKMCAVDERQLLKKKLEDEKKKNRVVNTARSDVMTPMTPRYSSHTPPVTPRNKLPPKFVQQRLSNDFNTDSKLSNDTN